jgi:hypothetical protein
MPAPCDPPTFDQRDWSEFDFSRWHLDGVTLEAGAAAFATLSDQLFNSEEWRRHFQETLPELQKQTLEFFKDNGQRLREQKDAVVRDFDQRIAAAGARSADFRKAAERAAGPPVGQASPGSYQLLARVTAEEGRLGLPGIGVRIMDPRNEKQVLAEAVTDLEGNAVLTVPPEAAAEVDKRDTSLQVLGPKDKVLLNSPAAVCVRLDQAETKVIALPDSREIEAHKTAASAIRSERDARMTALAAQVDTLHRQRASRLEELDCRLMDNEAIVAELAPAGAPPAPEAPPRKPRKGATPRG